MKYILAIDQGTTGTKTLLVDKNLRVVSESSFEFPQHFPKPGWVEHDCNEIWESVLRSIKKTTNGYSPSDIQAIGITNQRETLCFWNKETGEPISRAIVWQDRRTADICAELKNKGAEPFFQERTGLLLDPYFSGTKATWAFQNWPEVQAAYSEGYLAAGTIDSYLIARLAGGGVHVTEPSNASRTLCFDIHRCAWNSELCQTLAVPEDIWPEVLPSTGIFAKVEGVEGIMNGTPITGVLGDQQSALLGQACIEVGTAKCTYGTGSFLLLNTGANPIQSRHRLLSTIAWARSLDNVTYALEGSAFIAGAAVQWLRDGLEFVKDSREIEALANKETNTDGVVFVPALTGLGAPYWNPDARGLITGITRGTNRAHIARAVLEGIALQNADLLTAMKKDLGKPIKQLKVDGGAATNNLLMQFQADMLGVDLYRPKITQTTSLGAVFAAGLGCGIWTDLAEVQKSWQEDARFSPKISAGDKDAKLKAWARAVKMANLA